MNSTFILSSSFFNKRVCTSSKFDHKQQFDISVFNHYGNRKISEISILAIIYKIFQSHVSKGFTV